MITQFIIEGVDSLGKDTLIEAIQNKNGYYPVIHYQKPKILEKYNHIDIFGSPEYCYQYASFCNLMQLLNSKIKLITNRSHLGEYVYADLYRGYNGSYVFDLEEKSELNKLNHIKLVLLTTSDFSFTKDDGENFNFDNIKLEQEKFIDAFNQSIIPNKIIVDINDNGKRKTVEQILKEIGVY
jgi:hypothetical protein